MEMKKNDPLISVIVPIYNAEKYLEDCIESIIHQTYRDIEIILVNDGSTDRSPQICDRYAELDSRIIVVHQENKGLVAARKAGVSIAKGKYIGFVDSDDWLSLDTYTALMCKDNIDVDVISFGYCCVKKEENINVLNMFAEGIYKEENLENLYSRMMYDIETRCSGITRSLCCKLIKKTLLWECMSQLNEKITLGEDAAVVYNCCLKAKSIFLKNTPFYFYRVHEESMCRSKDEEVFTRVFYFYHYLENIFKEYDEDYKLVEQLNNYTFEFLQDGLNRNFNFIFGLAPKMPKITDIKIILYGAGVYGKEFYKVVESDENMNLVSWVDKKCYGQSIYGRLIEEPCKGITKEFDKVIIAVKNENVAMEIQKELLEMGVSQEKIVWKKIEYYNGNIKKLGWK